MCDKTTDITNICGAETPVDVIWPTTDFTDACLPVIGSCQVSSILSTLEKNISNENNDTFKSIPINIINSEDDTKKGKSSETHVLQKKQLFQEMIYFGCNLCPFICTKDSKISDHIQSVHKNKNNTKKPQLKCPGCTNIFYHKLSLRSHLIHDHEVGRSDINKIVNSIVYESVLQENNNQQQDEHKTDSKINQNNDNSIDCLQDDPPETSEPQIEDNYLPKQETNEIPLIINNEIIPKNNEILPKTNEIINKDSKIDEINKKNNKCCISTCAVRMSSVSNLSYHIKCHFGKVFRCLECNENFVIWKTLQTHLWRIHSIDMELYSCDKCNYKTYSQAKLNNIHKLIHGNEKSFLCDLCGKGYKNPKQLRNHKIIHKNKSQDKILHCNICNRTFTDKRILKIHIDAVHQKIKPFSCNYCSYKAASNGALKLHVRLHTGQKPFQCDQCDYSTADHNSLRRHKSRHTNEKKYKCTHCDYACIQSSTYKTHLKTKHPGLEENLMFSCPFCQFRSVNKDKYMIHISNHKDKKDQSSQKFIDIIENICETNDISIKSKNSDEFPSQKLLIPKKPRLEENLLRLQETPVALISKMDTNTSNCIILPVQNDNLLNLTNVSDNINIIPINNVQNNTQFFYNNNNVVVEIVNGKSK